MTSEQEQKIQDHLASFPDRHLDYLEFKKEWSEFKSRALLILIGFLASILAIGVWVGTIQSDHGYIKGDLADSNEKTKAVEVRVGVLEVNNGEIRTRLASIETILLEIKTDLAKLR